MDQEVDKKFSTVLLPTIVERISVTYIVFALEQIQFSIEPLTEVMVMNHDLLLLFKRSDRVV